MRTYIVSRDTVINMFYPTWSVLTEDRTVISEWTTVNTYHVTKLKGNEQFLSPKSYSYSKNFVDVERRC